MKREFSIRTATEDDIEILAELSGRTFKSAYESKLPGEALANFIASTFSRDRIRGEVSEPTNKFLLAYEGNHPIGYAMLRTGSPPSGVSGFRPIELARKYLEDVVIGRGYGSALMKACLEEAREGGYKTVWLGVWEQNEHAIRFYEKWGFEIVGPYAFDFGGEVHTDLLMERLN